MRMTALLAAAVLFAAASACDKGGGDVKPDVDPVKQADAEAFAKEWAAAAFPCDEAKLRELVDHDALTARFLAGGSSREERQAADELGRERVGAKVMCAWQASAEAYKLLRVRMVDGQPRPLFRRIAKDARTGLRAVAYDELMLGTSKSDHKVRAIDIYPYIQGEWLSIALRALTSAALSGDSASETLAIAGKMKDARELQKQGKYQEALALIDSLPPKVRKSRATQLMRVAVAGALSQDAYKQALDEVAETFPNDPSTALVEIDGAFLRKDYDAALRYIDIVDKALGGDPWQDAIRAEALIHRGKPGDLDAAAQRAATCVKAEDTLAKCWWATLDVKLAQKDWAGSLATMDELMARFHISLPEENLRKTEAYAGLVETPEYAAWRAKHP